MAYCRGDIYVYATGDDEIHCVACSQTFGTFVAKGPKEMLDHLHDHRDAGEFVPEDAIERLEREIEEDSKV